MVRSRSLEETRASANQAENKNSAGTYRNVKFKFELLHIS